MRILGIDHATRTGWSVLENGVCVKTGFFYLIKEGEERLLEYKRKIDKLIDEVKPDKIAMELPEHQRNGKVLRYLVGLYSMNKLSALEHEIRAYEINPTTMKKFITGNGRAKKGEVLRALVDLYGVEEDLITKPIVNTKGQVRDFYYDESDATALAIFLYNNTVLPIKYYE